MKNIIRKKIKDRLKNLSLNEIKNNSLKIKNNLNKIPEFNTVSKIGIYCNFKEEIHTKEIIQELLNNKKEVLLPRIKNDNLNFIEIKSLNELNPGKYGILEPNSNNIADKPELIILPAIAIDKTGNRIGRGKGYFDKYLNKNHNIKTICLVNNLQIVKTITPEKHDKKIDMIISEKKIIYTKNKKNLLIGTKHAQEITNKIKHKIKSQNINATLAVILVGNNESSQIYVAKKQEECKKVSINFKLIKFPQNIDNDIVKNEIENLNKSKEITGILIQLPLPKQLNTSMLLNTVNEMKDVDGLSDKSLTKLKKGNEFLACCTPKGIITLLEKNKINLKNKKIGIIGYGRLVGKPLSIMFKNRALDFFVCNKKTENLSSKAQQADILITATGVPNLINKEHVKNGAILIDAGTSKINGKTVGDTNFNEVNKIASKITPAIGGVGPMTIATLLGNIVKAYEEQNKKDQVLKKQSLKNFTEL